MTPPDSQGTTESQPTAPKDEGKCPACQDQSMQDWKDSEKESWVRCDACKKWFHWRCAGEGELDVIDKWYACHMLRLYAFLCETRNSELHSGIANHVVQPTPKGSLP